MLILLLPGNGLLLREDVPEVPGSQAVPQGGGCQQLGRDAGVVHIGEAVRGVVHLVVHDGIHIDCYTVLGQDLKE